MAYTASLVKETVFGDQRVKMYTVTADATSGAINTGLNYINAISMSPVSAATSSFIIRRNVGSAGTANQFGQILISAAVSGDAFQLVVFGQ